MARPLQEIVRLDRRWFRAHPERRHRCRHPDTGELDFFGVTAVRGPRWRIVYQPVVFKGALPAEER